MTADVATSLASWSSTAASNQPDNSDSVGPNILAENLRTIQAVVRDAVAGNGTIASATTTDLSTVNDNYIAVTGTTTITGLGTVSAGIVKVLKFAGVLTFTHNGTSLILPGATNITTAAGDVAVMRSEGSGNWRCLAYQRSSGIAATLGANNFTGAQNTARATVASAATTADIWAAAGNEIDWTGTTTCTGFPAAPQAGASRILHLAAAAPFTAGANMLIDGTTSGNTWTGSANDIVTVHAISTTQFRLEIKKYDGTAVVGESLGGTVLGAFRNLQASAAGTGANVTVTADEIVVENSSNAYQTLRAVSLTINTAGSGANGLDTGSLTGATWYSVWVIAKADGTTAGLISASATAPTMPADYTHKARIGWIRTDGTANKYPLCFKQSGRTTTYKVAGGSNLTALPAMASGVLGNISTPTWSAVAWANFAPSTAAAIHVVVSTPQNGTAMVAPNSSYGAYNSTSNPPLVVSSVPNTGGLWDNKKALIPLESSNIYVASVTGGMYLYALGWEDNL